MDIDHLSANLWSQFPMYFASGGSHTDNVNIYSNNSVPTSNCFLCKDGEGWGPLSQASDLTPCFLNGIMFNFASLFMLIFGTSQIFKLRKNQNRLYYFDWSFHTKLGLVLLQLVLNFSSIIVFAKHNDSGSNLNDVLFWSPVLTTVSTIVAFGLHYIEQFKSSIPNGILLFYWLFQSLFGIAKIINLSIRGATKTHQAYFVLSVFLEFNSIIILSLEWLIPKKTVYSDIAKVSPFDRADVFSRINFSWMGPLMARGYKTFLLEKDLPPLPKELEARVTSASFSKHWKKQLESKNPSLSVALVKTFGGPFVLGGIFKAIQDILAFVQPQLLRLLIKFVNEYSEAQNTGSPIPLTRGFMIAITMFLVSVIQTSVLHQYFLRAFDLGMKIKSALGADIYNKSLVLSNEDKQKKSTGDIVNLMAVDSQRIQDLTQNLQIIWSGPFQIILCLTSLYNLLGYSMFAGVLIMIIMIPLNGVLARVQKKLQKIQMKNKDERSRLISEILNNIKSLKLYGWEIPYQEKLNYVRNEKELKNLKKMGLAQALSSFTWNCAPFFVSCSTFAVFVLYEKKPLTTDIVFPALALFNLLSFPLAVVPMVITALVEAQVAIDRLTSYFTSGELQSEAVINLERAEKIGDVSVQIENGSFLWTRFPEYKVALQNINFTAKKGELSCIVGKVGSGKSSFIQAILGDLYRSEGSVISRGKIAYVAQVPWIMNGTIKDNILFGHTYDPVFYERTIKACALTVDLSILPKGDQTEVGEKGISLSGGQKARLSLARAVYARADIYLLDDPLCAVDEHVGKHIIDYVLGPKGLISHKAKILATNSIGVLSIAHNITMLSSGKIVQQGNYSDVSSDFSSPLGQLIRDFGNKKSSNSKVNSNQTSDSENGSELKDKVDEAIESTLDSRDLGSDDIIISEAASLRRASTATSTFDFEEQELDEETKARKEQHEQGKVKWNVYMTYAKACNPKGVVLFLSFILLSMSLSVVGNVWLKHWSEVNTKYGFNPRVGYYLGIYLALGIIASAIILLQTIILWFYCSIRGSKILHQQMAKSVLRAPMSFFETTPIGRILNRFSNDVYRVDEVLGRVFTQFFANTAKVLLTIVVICSSTWQFIFFVTPLGVLYIYYQQYYLRTSRELRRLDSVSRSPILAHFQETLTGVSTVRAYGQQTRFSKLNEFFIDKNMKAYHPSINANRWLAVRLEFLGSLIILGAAGLSIFSLKSGHLTAGMVGLSVSYSLQITQSLNWIVRMSVEVETNIVSVERIMEYSKLTPEAPEIVEYNRPPSNWPQHGEIRFNNYSTRYRPELDLILKNVSCTINPNEKVGIVGRTGAGKSSLTMALFRIIEGCNGDIEIDGVKTNQIGLSDLRHKLSIIPQDSQVFEGTIRSNLDPTNQFSDDEIWNALELSHLKDHVLKMSEESGEKLGLDVVLSEGGSNLSVGQRQLMCLARAILIPSTILILDEATAAVDVETDHVIQETIRKEFKNRTILTIAHRLNTILDSDRIIVLEKGQIAEFDTPANLLKKKESLFYSLCKQGGFVNEENAEESQ